MSWKSLRWRGHGTSSSVARYESSWTTFSCGRIGSTPTTGRARASPIVSWPPGPSRSSAGDRKAHCDVATFFNAERRVICRGRAALQQGCDLVRGEEIHFDLENERVLVKGGASVVIRNADDDCTGEQL